MEIVDESKDATVSGSSAHDEAARLLQICNACRYCEGFCAVFPAMERRIGFDEGDTAFLANLCHQCGACHHACQYAPPHEFGVNVPLALAQRRVETYEEYAWPALGAKLFERNGLAVSAVIVAALSVTLALMLAMIAPEKFWGAHLGEGAFYRVMPYHVMAGIPLLITGFVLVAFVMGVRAYWRRTRAPRLSLRAWIDALHATASLKYLGGDNSGGAPGCPVDDERNSSARRHAHHLTFYGFGLCFAATCAGTLYHYLLGREAPYGYFEVPVLLGTSGGTILCIGTAWLWRLKKKTAKEITNPGQMGMDYAFIWLLFWVSATGLLLLAVRETGFMGLTLAIHLAFVYGFFLVLPYSKFVHGIYRFAALLADAGEKHRR